MVVEKGEYDPQLRCGRSEFLPQRDCRIRYRICGIDVQPQFRY